jgi:hypothetical protein
MLASHTHAVSSYLAVATGRPVRAPRHRPTLAQQTARPLMLELQQDVAQ